MLHSLNSSLIILSLSAFLLTGAASADRDLQATGEYVDGYEYRGTGYCQDSSGNPYDYLRYSVSNSAHNSAHGDISTPAGCEGRCPTTSTSYRGFSIFYDTSNSYAPTYCYCWFDDGTVPSGAGEDYQLTSNSGTGVVTQVSNIAYGSCYTQAAPSTSPSSIPSIVPSDQPSLEPSVSPSSIPSVQPSLDPSDSPSSIPSTEPSETPSIVPSDQPSLDPSDSPSSIPSTEPSETPSIEPSDQPSFEPSASPSLIVSPSTEPSETPSCTPSIAPTPSPSLNLFYPDQVLNGFETACLNDGMQPAWMDASPTYWLFSSLAACCNHHFKWNIEYCLGSHDDTCARAYWYPDWELDNKSCKRDGNEPIYMSSNPGNFLFSSKGECCEEHYNWNIDECMSSGESGNGATAGITSTVGKWYADWTSGDENCKQDTSANPAPQYMKTNVDCWMFDDQVDCCNRYFMYTLSECLGTSAVASNKYFPDWSNDDNECKQDTSANPAPQYMRESSLWLFDTLDACCEAYFSYNEASCKGQTSTTSGTSGSNEWYVVWGNPAKCVKNCAVGSGTGCGGLAKGWDDKYPTQAKCCSTRVSYAYRECMA